MKKNAGLTALIFLSLVLIISPGCEKNEIEPKDNEGTQVVPAIFFSKPLLQGEVVTLIYTTQNADFVFCNEKAVSFSDTLIFCKCDTLLNFTIVKNGISTFREIRISKASFPEIQIRPFDSLYPAGGTAHVFFTSTNATAVRCEGKEYSPMGTFVFDIVQTEVFEIELVGPTANSKVQLTVPVRVLTETDKMRCQSKWNLTILQGATTTEGPWYDWELTDCGLQTGMEFFLNGNAKLYDCYFINGKETTWDEVFSGETIEQSLSWDTLVLIRPVISIRDGIVYNEFNRETYTH